MAFVSWNSHSRARAPCTGNARSMNDVNIYGFGEVLTLMSVFFSSLVVVVPLFPGGFTIVVLLSFLSGGLTVVVFCSHAANNPNIANR